MAPRSRPHPLPLRAVVCLGLLALGPGPALALPGDRVPGLVAGPAPEALARGNHRPGRPWWTRLASLGPYLQSALVLWLVALDPGQPAQGQPAPAPPPQPPASGAFLQALNLGATDAGTVVAAQGVARALTLANQTGALPSFQELNALLARNSVSFRQPCAT